METDKKKALGRGLASLIPEARNEGDGGSVSKKEFFFCDIEKIVPNTYQPRKIFQKEALEELVESVKAHGIIQPILVRQRDGHFEIIAGERRWRAAQRAGLKQVPVVIKDIAGDSTSLEMAIVENVQRADLNCIEEAIAYQQLMDEFQLSQEDIAAKVGKNRVTVANTMRLLKLPSAIREDITASRLTMGHARALLALESTEDQLNVRELIIKKKLSVREAERKVNEIIRAKGKGEPAAKGSDTHLQALEEDLNRRFGCSVRILGNNDRGTIQISYATSGDLMRVADMLKGPNVPEEIGSI
ncbi:MAG: ParB/RepB/Spo0J family partition protein [Deltaproteobacteria bacterium]|nr:ParB/RepB/Spo0J family partition protein [Deltaproteobacteria bacterium]